MLRGFLSETRFSIKQTIALKNKEDIEKFCCVLYNGDIDIVSFLSSTYEKEEKMKQTNEFIMKPKVDFCFKELMTDADIRRGFISALLGIRPEEIAETTLMQTHLRKQHAEDKLGILDIRVRLDNKLQMNVEMQVAPFEYWQERSLFYLGKMYTDQIQEGEDYEVLEMCIYVGILDFTLFKECEQYASCFHLWEENRKELYSDKLEVHILELPKLLNYEYAETELLNWAKFMSAERKEELKQMAEKNEYLEKAYDKLVVMSEDKEKRLEYEAREKAIRDYNHQMRSNYRQGMAVGIEQGIGLGVERGIQQTQEKYSSLIQKLLKENRLDLLESAAEDPKKLQELFKEYNL